MTCKIDRLDVGEDLVILRISGRITGKEVAMLRDVLEQERGREALDLKDVLLVDREAVKLLAFPNRTEPNSETVWPMSVNGSQRDERKCAGVTNNRKEPY